jgi:hypothetical protein
MKWRDMTPTRALIGVTFFSGGWYAMNQWYYLLSLLGSVMSLIALGLIAIPLFLLGGWLQNHRDPRVRDIGVVYLSVWEHTVLLQGTLLSLLVFWSLFLLSGGVEIPETRHAFLIDFFPAVGLFSVMIYGGAFGMEAAFAKTIGKRVFAWILTAIVLTWPIIAFVVVDDALDAFAASSPGLYGFGWILYLTVGSVVYIRVSFYWPGEELGVEVAS